MEISKQDLNDWYQNLRDATDMFTQAEKVTGRTVAERSREAYRLRNGARTKVSNIMFILASKIKELEDDAG